MKFPQHSSFLPNTLSKNDQNRLPFYGYDFRADNAVISVNDYAPENRGVSFDTLYADNAYINTNDTNLGVQDGYINNYAGCCQIREKVVPLHEILNRYGQKEY